MFIYCGLQKNDPHFSTLANCRSPAFWHLIMFWLIYWGMLYWGMDEWEFFAKQSLWLVRENRVTPTRRIWPLFGGMALSDWHNHGAHPFPKSFWVDHFLASFHSIQISNNSIYVTDGSIETWNDLPVGVAFLLECKNFFTFDFGAVPELFGRISFSLQLARHINWCSWDWKCWHVSWVT